MSIGGYKKMTSYKLKLKEYRLKRNLTQTDMAKKLGVATSVISDYERGVFAPSLARTIDMANILGVTLDEFIQYEKAHKAYSEELADIFYEKKEKKS